MHYTIFEVVEFKNEVKINKNIFNTSKVRFYFQKKFFFSNASPANSIRHIKKLKFVIYFISSRNHGINSNPSLGTPSLLVNKITSYILVPTFQGLFEFVVQSQRSICSLSSSSSTRVRRDKLFVFCLLSYSFTKILRTSITGRGDSN